MCIRDSHIDYINGRAIKIGCIENWPMLPCELYDRDNGIGKMKIVSSSKQNVFTRALHNIEMDPILKTEAKLLYDELFG